jgi:hypothetical protein
MVVKMEKFGWWQEKGEEAAQCLFSEIKHITQKESSRLHALMRYLRLYTGRANMTVSTVDLVSRLRMIQDVSKIVDTGLEYNVVQSTINTLHSKMCKRKERVRFLTNGGSWELQRKAQKMDRLMYGVFMDARVHEQNMKQTLDSYWAGSGFVNVTHKIQKGKLKIVVDRINPSEIVVDFEDAENGSPVCLRRIKAVNVDLLKGMYPQYETRIDLLTQQNTAGNYDSVTRQILVAEAWHLPDDNGHGGRHVLAIKNAILAEEDYEHYEFPIIKQDYLWAPYGYYGIGMAELLMTHQRELDNLVQYRQLCLKRGSNPRTYVERSSNVSIDQLTNAPNAIVEYSGTMPQQEVRPPYAGELARDIEEIYQKAYNEAGISQLSAMSSKPAGLNSGKAIREYSDIESERFQTAGQNRQIAHIEIAKAIIREIEIINQRTKNDVAGYRAAKKTIMSYDKEAGLEEFEYKDFDLPSDEYLIQLHNTSMFPQKPEGQLEFAQELASAGLIDQADALELLDFPDTQTVLNRNLSSQRYARQVIEKILDNEQFISPDPYEDHARNFSIATKYYTEAKLKGLDEVKLSLLRQYLDANDRFIKMAQESQMAEQQAIQSAAQPMPPEIPMM